LKIISNKKGGKNKKGEKMKKLFALKVYIKTIK